MALLPSLYLLNLNSVCVYFTEIGNLIKCADELGQIIDFSENMISIITIAIKRNSSDVLEIDWSCSDED